MLAKLGCRYVVVGHSERREYHGETDEVVNAKVRAALRNGITPILCVGEGLPTSARRASTSSHCTAQLTAALARVTAEQAADLVVAYEPVWAIGTGRVASPADAQEVCAALRATLATLYGEEQAAGVRVLYGGSVKADNVGRADGASPTSTARWSAGRASTSRSSRKLCALRRGRAPLP